MKWDLCLTTCQELLLFSFSRFVWIFDIKKNLKGPRFLSSTESTDTTTCHCQTCVVFFQILVDHVEKLAAYKCMLTTLSINLFLLS